MSARYYRLLLGVAASLSLLGAGLTSGCSSDRPAHTAAAPAAGASAAAQARADQPDVEATLWTVLGLAKRPSQRNVGPITGDEVSPVLWQAALDTMHFAGLSSEDPMTGLLVTKWYSPPNNPAEQLRVSVFILSRALRSTSLAVTVERQVRSPDGQWTKTPIARDVVEGLESAILHRAQQIHSQRYRNSM